MLRELRGMRPVLDAQLVADPGRFQVQLPQGSAADIVQEAIVRPLNAKLGRDCFALAGATGPEVTIAYAPACATPEMRTQLETGAPAGSRLVPASGRQGARRTGRTAAQFSLRTGCRDMRPAAQRAVAGSSPRRASLPGYAPGGAPPFFGSPKKVSKERRPHCL